MATPDDTPAENGWLFRRIYTYVVTLINLCFIGVIAWKLDDPDALKWVALALIGFNAIMAGLYMAGASVIDYAQLASAWKGGQVEDLTRRLQAAEESFIDKPQDTA